MASVSASSGLVGNRIYRGSSFAPSLGTNDPTGYITRGIRQSNRRSGLAQNAMQSMASRLMQRNQGPRLTPPNLLGQRQSLITSPTGRISFQGSPIQFGQLPNVAGTSNAQGTGTNDVLPFDPGAALQEDQLTSQRDSALNKLNSLRQQLMEGTTSKERALDQAAPDLARRLLDQYAGHGMAYSSGYGYGVGQQQQDLANQKAELERQQSEGLAGYNQQEGDINTQYNQAKAMLQYQIAQALANQAGTLGLGQSNSSVSTGGSNPGGGGLVLPGHTINTAGATQVINKAASPVPRTIKKTAARVVARKPSGGLNMSRLRRHL